MRDILQIIGIVAILIGFTLFMGGRLEPATSVAPVYSKGGFASVTGSGVFRNLGVALIMGGVPAF